MSSKVVNYNKTKRNKKRMSPLMIILCVILVLYTISLFLPLVWGFFTSLKGKYELRHNMFGLPEEWLWINYLKAFNSFKVPVEVEEGFSTVYLEQMMLYSVLYAVGCAVIQAVVTCVMAYATAKFSHYFLSKVIYSTVLIVMMLPIVGSLPSEIALAQRLGLYNTIWGMWVLKFNFLGMYYLVFHATFRGIPKDFSEAAYIDGASEWAVMLKIIFPMVKGTLSIIILLNFIGYWNDYQTPMLFMPRYPTMSYGLYAYTNSLDQDILTDIPGQLTGCMLLMLPILIIFLIFHNKLIGNISMGGLKE